MILSALPWGCHAAKGTVSLNVDAAFRRHPISPEIYGIADGLDLTFAREIRLENVRWGGDATSRYNWKVDSGNAGADWYFMGGGGSPRIPTPSGSVDAMINDYKPAQASALVTIPIIPYLNKSYSPNCSFPVSIYGPQTSTNPYVFPVTNGISQTCGNGISADLGQRSTPLLDRDILSNHISNSAALQQEWVQHLVDVFGSSRAGGVKYYQLDNEPLGWSNTHRDIQPAVPAYATIAELGQNYAAAIKQIDPFALILGPSDFTLGGWVGAPTQQGGLWAGQYYLQQMAAYEQVHHVRLLDYFDEHYYFETSTPAAQLASTRTLWDPTYDSGTWVEKSAFHGPMQLIPRFKRWIKDYYPGTKLAISEYSIDSGRKSIVDAIAEMKVLGIFGREQLDFANMWSPPSPTDPIAYSFRMFRNYDGEGHAFGDISIGAFSSDPTSLSLFAAERTSDHAVTVLAINDTATPIKTAVALHNIDKSLAADVFVYSARNLKSIVRSPDVPIKLDTMVYECPGYSAVLFIVHGNRSSTNKDH